MTGIPGFATPLLRATALVLVLLLAAFSRHATAADAPVKPLEIGIIPNVSTHALFAAYQPLRLYLEQRLGRPVILLTAPDFKTFYERTGRGDYDLAITPPHLARLAEIESGYVPLTTYKNELGALLLVAENSPIKTVADLRGKTIGMPDLLALAPMAGRHWLEQRGLKAHVDYALRITAPHNTAVLSVVRGDTAAAIVGTGPYGLMAKELHDGVRVLANVGSVINATFMANPRLSADERTRIKDALLAFANESPEGKKFVKDNDFGGMKPLSSRDLKTMDRYTKEAKFLLQAAE